MTIEQGPEVVESSRDVGPDYRRLPPRIPVAEMSTSQPASPPPDPGLGRDPHREALFDTAN